MNICNISKSVSTLDQSSACNMTMKKYNFEEFEMKYERMNPALQELVKQQQRQVQYVV